MAYQQYGVVQATDFNGYAGSVSNPQPNTLNAIYGVGRGRYGYGQPSILNVLPNDIVGSTIWSSLINGIVKCASHQGTSITTIPLTDYEPGDYIIASLSGGTSSIFAQDINAINVNYNNTVAQGTTLTTYATNNTSWSTQLTFLFTVSFATGDHARYFFNSGGQLAINISHPNSSGINSMWNTLGLQFGTMILSAPNTGNVNIAGTNYSGLTKLGGSGNPTSYLPNLGYYGLSSSWNTAYRLSTASGISKYLQSYVSLSIKSNGARASNGDNGNLISFIVKLDQVPDGGSTLLTGPGTTVSLTVRPPSTSYLTNTWGTPSVNYQLGNTLGYSYV
jgi:hypothetical protein